MAAEKSSDTPLSRFKYEKLLQQDSAGRRLALQGSIDESCALLLIERAAFDNDDSYLQSLAPSLASVQGLGANDVYRWYLANIRPALATPTTSSSQITDAPQSMNANDKTTTTSHAADCKLTLIWPADAKHIKKYSPQVTRVVTETPEIYARHVKPWIEAQIQAGRLDWVYNILDGRSEQEDIIYRSPAGTKDGEGDGYLVLPDLNWDRKTIDSLRLLALVERRDLRSVRDLKKKHVPWLRSMLENLAGVIEEKYGPREGRAGVERDMLKFYVHYHPTYYHLHIHILHANQEPNATQAVCKALSLHNIISQLETMSGDEEAGMANVDITYVVGEASDLWRDIFGPLKRGEMPARGS